MSGFRVEFLVRDNCHLCEDARPIVVSEVGRAGGSVIDVDVDSDDSLLRDYGMRIPVVRGPDGTVLDEGLIDRKRLRRALRNVEN